MFNSRVLILEDDIAVGENLRDHFLRENLDACLVTSLEEAVDQIDSRVAVLILDYDVSGGSGIEIGKKMLSHDSLLYAPPEVVVYSSDLRREVLLGAWDVGAVHFFEKSQENITGLTELVAILVTKRHVQLNNDKFNEKYLSFYETSIDLEDLLNFFTREVLFGGIKMSVSCSFSLTYECKKAAYYYEVPTQVPRNFSAEQELDQWCSFWDRKTPGLLHAGEGGISFNRPQENEPNSVGIVLFSHPSFKIFLQLEHGHGLKSPISLGRYFLTFIAPFVQSAVSNLLLHYTKCTQAYRQGNVDASFSLTQFLSLSLKESKGEYPTPLAYDIMGLLASLKKQMKLIEKFTEPSKAGPFPKCIREIVEDLEDGLGNRPSYHGDPFPVEDSVNFRAAVDIVMNWLLEQGHSRNGITITGQSTDRRLHVTLAASNKNRGGASDPYAVFQTYNVKDQVADSTGTRSSLFFARLYAERANWSISLQSINSQDHIVLSCFRNQEHRKQA